MDRTYCEFPECGVAVRLDFADPESARRLLGAVSDQVYGNRLPRLRFVAQSPLELGAAISFDFSDRHERVTIAFSDDVGLAPVETDQTSVRWDFWIALGTLLLRVLLKRGIVAFHAACLQIRGTTWLVPGDSGAGKSVLSFLARAHGGRVFASELSFVREGSLVAGNCMMCVDDGALAAHRLSPPGEGTAVHGAIVSPTDAPGGPVPLSGVVFPKVTAGGDTTQRAVSSRRTRQLLYDNAVGQVRLGLSPSPEDLLHIARETRTVAESGAARVEGPAREVWDRLAGAAVNP
jgi:hypothetical protein